MTDTTQQPQDKPSGIDIARQALADYKNSTWAIPTRNSRPARPRLVRPHTRNSDPMPIGDALTDLCTDPAWESGVAAGGVFDQWDTLCPQYVGRVQPIHYDDNTGTLTLKPASTAYATQLRLLGRQLMQQINGKVGKQLVRSLRVLPPGNITDTPADDTPAQAQPEGPVKTRETASPGFKAAMAAHLSHRPESEPTDPYVLEAMARQEAALRAHRQPESEHREAQWAAADQPTEDTAEASRQAAIRRARDERANRGATVHRLFPDRQNAA